VGDGHGLRGLPAVDRKSQERWRCKIAGTKDESGVLDNFGADGCGGNWLCVCAEGDGDGAWVLAIGGSSGGAGFGVLVDWETSEEREKLRAEESAEIQPR